MKNIFFLSVLLNFCFFGQTTQEDVDGNDNSIPLYHIPEDSSYIPLQTGNLYQYIEGGYAGGIVSYYLRYGTVLGDTLINNQKYYNYSYNNSINWFKYSEADKKLYKRLNEDDLVYMNFNKAPGDTFIHLDNFNYPIPARVLGGDTSIFSMNYPYKGYIVSTGPGGTKKELFARGLGIIETKYEYQGAGSSHNSKILIMAILYDSIGNSVYFTNHYKPEISVIPITLIDSSNFKLNVSVTHQYNKITPPGHTSLYFIASVQLDSYYSNEDSIIELPLINANQIINLDTMLMRNGFTFNYRIIAKDRGIIPETSYSPDTGYYQCIWDFGTEVGENEEFVNDFLLFQNYPNPFNPSTSIEYRVGSSEYVTLKVFDVLGSEVAILVNEEKEPGVYEVEFNPVSGIRDLASGIYYYQLKAGSFSQTKKMIYLK